MLRLPLKYNLPDNFIEFELPLCVCVCVCTYNHLSGCLMVGGIIRKGLIKVFYFYFYFKRNIWNICGILPSTCVRFVAAYRTLIRRRKHTHRPDMSRTHI